MFKKKKHRYSLIRVNIKLIAATLGTLLVLSGVTLMTVRAMEGESVELPIIMYHSVLKDEGRHGKYVVSPSEFENDMTYLKNRGYTTVLMADLLAYTQGGELPEKPILITFDDGYYNNYLYAFEIARQQQCKFVISPIGTYAQQYTDQPDENAYYSHATWEQLREMRESGLVEIQNHSYDLHHTDGKALGTRQQKGESSEAYEERFSQDVLKAQQAIEEQVGVRPNTFVYPFGAISNSAPGLVKKLGFSASLTCEEKMNRITRNPDSLYNLGRFLRPSGGLSKDFFEKTVKLNG